MRHFAKIASVVMLMCAASAYGHETPVALLSINEGRDGTFWLDWTYYSTRADIPPEVEWPAQCREDYPRLDCGAEGLLGQVSMPQIGDTYSAAVIQIKSLNGPPRSYTITGGNRSLLLTADGTLPWQWVAASYVPLGIEHIMLGVDHLLFVLGLIVLVQGTSALIKTITSFTIAHSITLAAATLGWVGVPEQPVNAAIALSIMVLAVEMLNHRAGRPGLSSRLPWLIAFGFGLLHGFGFAGAMTNVGLPQENLPAALLFFNIGVEIGQIGFVLLILWLYQAHRRLGALLPSWTTQAGIYGMGGIASYWFIGRLIALVSVP